jgi:hypothetical protein
MNPLLTALVGYYEFPNYCKLFQLSKVCWDFSYTSLVSGAYDSQSPAQQKYKNKKGHVQTRTHLSVGRGQKLNLEEGKTQSRSGLPLNINPD